MHLRKVRTLAKRSIYKFNIMEQNTTFTIGYYDLGLE